MGTTTMGVKLVTPLASVLKQQHHESIARHIG